MDKDTTLLIIAAFGLFLYMQSQKQAAPQVIYQPTPTEGGGNTTGEIVGIVRDLVKIGTDVYSDYRSAQATDYDNATLAYT